MSVFNRYSDSDLTEFRALIEAKLAVSTDQYQNLMSQIKEITENTSGDYTKDISDFSSSQSEVDMLNTMANRQRTYTHDLQAALVRVRNKTYGICAITGEMIDKRRLLAVPTTTKSLLAKAETEALKSRQQSPRKAANDDDDEDDEKPKRKVEPKKPKVLTKVIKKTSDAPGAKKPVDDLRALLGDDDDDDDDDLDVDRDILNDLELSDDDEDDDDMDD